MIVTAPHGYRTLYCDHCGKAVKIPIHCSDRTCEFCTRSRSHRVRSVITHILSYSPNLPKYSWKHLVLTIRNTHDLDSGLDHLIRSFRRLRSYKWWKSRVIGGAYILEVTHSDSGWHPHLHVILYSKYLPWSSVLSHWKLASRGSLHIRINKIWHGVGIAGYIAKYVSKPFTVDPKFHSQLVNETRHRRLFCLFGNLSLIFKTHKLPKYIRPCPRCGRCDWIPDVLIEIYRRRSRSP